MESLTTAFIESQAGTGLAATPQSLTLPTETPKTMGAGSPELTHDIPKLLAELETLKASQRELEAKQYIDASMARFSDLLRWRVDASIEEWADQLLVEMVPYVHGMQAALYVMEPEAQEPHLRLIGTYAAPEDTRSTIRISEGLTGQAARNGREIYLTEGHTFQSHTATSLTQIRIGALLILPLTHQENVEGVIEIGFAGPAPEHLLTLLRRFAAVLAASLGTVRSQVRIQKLYHEAQQYSEQMAAQEEEMRQNLEELQATQEEMRRVQTEIQANERRMKDITNNVPGMVYQFRLVPSTGEMGFVYASNKSRELLGLEPTELYRSTNALLMHTEDLEASKEALGVSAQNLSPFKFDVRIQLESGYEWFRMESTPALQADGSIVWNGYLQNINAQQLMRKELDEQNKELRAREIKMRENVEELRMNLTRVASIMQANVEEALRILTEQLSNQLGVNQVGVWKLNEVGIISVDVFTASLNAHSSGLELPRASFPKYFEAIGSGKVVSAPDAVVDPQTAEFKDYFAQFGISSLLDVPVFMNNELWGVVCLEHSGSIRKWSDEDIVLARTIADFVSNSLQNAENKKSLSNISQNLALAEKRMQAAFKLAKVGYWDLDLSTNEVRFSPTWLEMLGYDATKFVHQLDTFEKLCHPEDIASINAKINQAIENEIAFEASVRMKNAKGKWVTALTTGTLHRNETGNPAIFSGIQCLQ